MPGVPNWIPRAVIYVPRYSGPGEITPIMGYRATRTQVIVTAPGLRGPVERRFRLSDLTEVGDKHYGSRRTRLASPDEPEVRADMRQPVVDKALASVLTAVNAERLQDGGQTADEATRKLLAVQSACAAALALLSEVL